MRASETLIQAVKEFEGCKLYAYRDAVGVPTIGYGHTKNVRMGMAVSQQQADKFLLDDIAEVERELGKIDLPELTQGQWDAIIDFCFNLGIGNFKSSTLYKCLKAGASATEVQNQFRRWVYAGKTKLPGLVKRREWEAQRWIC